MLFAGRLNTLLEDESVLATSRAWKTFIEKLAESGIPLRRFRTIDWKRKQEMYRNPTGYYGPIGMGIIGALLRYKVFGPRNEVEAAISDTLTALLTDHTDVLATIELQDFWDNANGLSIPYSDFIDFILVPHAVNLLILEDYDFDITEIAANECRLNSGDFGSTYHDDEDLMDDMMMEISRPKQSLNMVADKQAAVQQANLTNGSKENVDPDPNIARVPVRFARKALSMLPHQDSDARRVTLKIPPKHLANKTNTTSTVENAESGLAKNLQLFHRLSADPPADGTCKC